MILTPTEREVLVLTSRGLPRKTIGRDMGITENTVNDHLKAIFDKMGVHNRMQAVVKAMRAGLLPEEA